MADIDLDEMPIPDEVFVVGARNFDEYEEDERDEEEEGAEAGEYQSFSGRTLDLAFGEIAFRGR